MTRLGQIEGVELIPGVDNDKNEAAGLGAAAEDRHPSQVGPHVDLRSQKKPRSIGTLDAPKPEAGVRADLRGHRLDLDRRSLLADLSILPGDQRHGVERNQYGVFITFHKHTFRTPRNISGLGDLRGLGT